MNLPIYIIDAFANVPFQGSYVAVVPLKDWLAQEMLQAIATENNLSETAFLVKRGENDFDIRWFSPHGETEFSSNATFASAFVVFKHMAASPRIVLRAASVGTLPVMKIDDRVVEMSFPEHKPSRVRDIPLVLITGLSIVPTEVWSNGQAYIAVYANEDHALGVIPFIDSMRRLGAKDVCVTAPGGSHDFVFRYFAIPNDGELDPVSGAIRAGVASFWAYRLQKDRLVALQASRRTSSFECRMDQGHTCISGSFIQDVAAEIELDLHRNTVLRGMRRSEMPR